MRRVASLSIVLVAAFGPLGCFGEPAPEGTAQVVAEIQSVPAGVGCLRLVYRLPGATADTTRNFGVTAGQSAILDLGYLAPGTYAIRPTAFNVACGSVANSTVASWVGDTVGATLAPGYATRIAITLRPNVTTTTAVDFIQPVRAIFADRLSDTTFAVMQDGTVRAWGRNDRGQMGDGTTATSDLPRTVVGLTNPTSIVGTDEYSCAATPNGLACWGRHWGKLADDGPLSNLTPRFNADIEPSTLSANDARLCGQFGEFVSCWHSVETLGAPAVGAAAFALRVAPLGWGEQGLAVVRPSGILERTNELSPGMSSTWVRSRVRDVAVSSTRLCAITVNGGVACWVADYDGSLGGELTMGIGAVTSLRAGTSHFCALREDRSVHCWGLNFEGQLGAGLDDDNAVSPVEVPVTEVSQIALGRAHTCALRTDGAVWCWGGNQYGQLGDGTRINRFTPVRVRF
ncbi:MAG: hypothetical protein U0325_23025 [Polyangiales bacterium]